MRVHTSILLLTGFRVAGLASELITVAILVENIMHAEMYIALAVCTFAFGILESGLAIWRQPNKFSSLYIILKHVSQQQPPIAENHKLLPCFSDILRGVTFLLLCFTMSVKLLCHTMKFDISLCLVQIWSPLRVSV